MAKTLQPRILGFPPLEAPPWRTEARALAMHAETLAESVTPYVEHFIHLGQEADFVARLREAGQALNAAVIHRAAKGSQRVGATVGVAVTIQRANTHLRAISAQVRKHARRHPTLVAEWRNVRRLPAHGQRTLKGQADLALPALPSEPSQPRRLLSGLARMIGAGSPKA